MFSGSATTGDTHLGGGDLDLRDSRVINYIENLRAIWGKLDKEVKKAKTTFASAIDEN